MEKQPLYLQPVALDLAWNDSDENLKKIEEYIGSRLDRTKDQNVSSEAKLFVFPELSLTGFVTKEPKTFSLKPPHPAIKHLMEIARKHRTGIAAGFPEANPADAKRPFNTLALIGPDGGIVASYRKMHLFTVGPSPESSFYAAGDSGVICDYRGWNIGLTICFDLRFPELYMQYARAGADVILAPACWVGGPHKSYQFQTLGSAHAILTQAYIVSVNRSGKDPFFEYDGAKYVFSPFGENIYQGVPCALAPAELGACRKMSVRSADREAYPILARGE